MGCELGGKRGGSVVNGGQWGKMRGQCGGNQGEWEAKGGKWGEKGADNWEGSGGAMQSYSG